MNNARFGKFLVILNGAVPAALLAWDAWHGQLGANPVNFAIRTTGLLALIFLLLSLAISPVKQLTGWNALVHVRRNLGLYAFFYAAAHFGIFFWWDRARGVGSTLHEIYARDYLWFGTAALL
ncbi:MAG: ferric reductase-like transmembrane domain-containing protein, partial [Tepidisphaeraceae bacterium]